MTEFTKTTAVRATSAVVEFIGNTRWPDFPPDAVALAKRCLIDGLGVVLAGSTTRGSAMLRDYIQTSDGAFDATVFAPETCRCGVAQAALANGASGHAMDFDDTQLSSTPDRIFGLLTHPTVPPLAAALADPEPLVRAHAAWALGRLGGPCARGALESARGREIDPAAAAEITGALATL